MQAPTKTSQIDPRGFGRKEHFMPQLLPMCPRPDSTQSTRGPRLLSFLLAPPNATFSTPTREFSARSARGPDHGLSTTQTATLLALRPEYVRLGALGDQMTIFYSHTKPWARIRALTRTTRARLPCRHLASDRFEVMIGNNGFTINKLQSRSGASDGSRNPGSPTGPLKRILEKCQIDAPPRPTPAGFVSSWPIPD